MEAPHDDRHLGLERLGRRGLEKSERGIAAVDAVAAGPSAAAADHRLDHGDVAPARLRVRQRERHHAALTAAGRRNVLGHREGQGTEHRVVDPEHGGVAHAARRGKLRVHHGTLGQGLTLPEGSVVNPKFPAACGVRYATVLRIYDAVLGALARAVPEDIPAASGGQGCMVALSLPDPEAGRRHVTVIEPMIGGGGGRPSRDGIDGCDASLGFLKTTPAETLEAEVPIVVRRYHLIQDSAGPGRFRGGFGVRLDFQVFQPEGLVTARGMERLRFAPWGVAGGTAGATGSVVLNPGTAGERPLPKIDVLALEPGDVLSMRTPGGGGNGDPLERPVEAVAADVEAGLVTPAHARAAYGVVMADGAIDPAATSALRAECRAAAGPLGP